MNAIKKILLLILPFMLLSCASKTPAPLNESTPTVASETMASSTVSSPEPDKVGTNKPKPPSEKTETKNETAPVTDTETDKIAEEIDKIFDELING